MTKKTRADKADSSKQRILDAAFTLFISNGYNGTSIQDIALKANVNKALLFYYFENKENLFEQAIKAPADIFHNQLSSDILNIKSPVKRLKDVIDAYMDMFDKKKELLHLLISELICHSKGLDHSIKNFMKYFVEKGIAPIEDAIKYGIKEKVFIKVNPRIEAILILGMIRSFGTFEITTGQVFPSNQLKKRSKEIILKNLLIPALRKG